MSAKVQRLDDHILDAEEIVSTEVGVWFAHGHGHEHGGVADEELLQHDHRHDHRRRSNRGDYDHHVIAATRPAGGSHG